MYAQSSDLLPQFFLANSVMSGGFGAVMVGLGLHRGSLADRLWLAGCAFACAAGVVQFLLPSLAPAVLRSGLIAAWLTCFTLSHWRRAGWSVSPVAAFMLPALAGLGFGFFWPGRIHLPNQGLVAFNVLCLLASTAALRRLDVRFNRRSWRLLRWTLLLKLAVALIALISMSAPTSAALSRAVPLFLLAQVILNPLINVFFLYAWLQERWLMIKPQASPVADQAQSVLQRSSGSATVAEAAAGLVHRHAGQALALMSEGELAVLRKNLETLEQQLPCAGPDQVGSDLRPDLVQLQEDLRRLQQILQGTERMLRAPDR